MLWDRYFSTAFCHDHSQAITSDVETFLIFQSVAQNAKGLMLSKSVNFKMNSMEW